MDRIPLFNRKNLEIKSLAHRRHDLDISVVSRLVSLKGPHKVSLMDKSIGVVAKRLIQAKKNHAAIIFMMGAHVLRAGVQNFLIDLMRRGYISCIAMNGAGIIHDFEFALIGATTESVSMYISAGQFGLWKETARLNDIINRAYRRNKKIGMGEAIGGFIENSGFAHKSISVLAAAYRLGIPATVHVGIGYDIIHEHPNCDGASTGALSYNDFLKFASVVCNLESGVIMNFGSAIMAPEVFLKALSMARNVAHQEGKEIRHFTSVVCDLYDLPKDLSREPPKDNPYYYFRPWKTMLVRTVADGGVSFYIKGEHRQTIPALWGAIRQAAKK